MALYVDIEKTLGDFRLRVKFEAQEGVTALLGASGCGKSMTLKCIAGIEKPDRGRIVLDGRVLFDSEARIDLAPQKRRVGYLFQQYALFPNMTVYRNIACGVRDKSKINSAVSEMIKAMRLDGLENKRPHQLSGGEQQRVALARILVNEPELLLLDEPFSALDSHLRFRLEREVSEVIKAFGKPAILVSHDRDEVFRLSDSIAAMNNGGIDVFGTKHEVFRAPRTKNAAVLTGCKNISAAQATAENRVFARDWGLELTVSGSASDADYVGIRMHDVCLGHGENCVSCAVAAEIENPFSYTVMLLPDGADSTIGIELEKSLWQRSRAERVEVSLPPESILLLKE